MTEEIRRARVLVAGSAMDPPAFAPGWRACGRAS